MEKLYLINEDCYLHVQSCDTGLDYTLYQKDEYAELDGGRLDTPVMDPDTVLYQIADFLGIDIFTIDETDIDILDDILATQ